MGSVKDAIAYGLRKAQYKDVREHQRKVIEGYCSGKDVFLSAPTGSGKSLTFEVAPCFRLFRARRKTATGRP